MAQIVEEEQKQLQSFLENMCNNILKSQCDILWQLFLQRIPAIKQAKENLDKIQTEQTSKSKKKRKIGCISNITPLNINKMQYWGKL